MSSPTGSTLLSSRGRSRLQASLQDPTERSYLQVVEADLDFPIVEAEVLMAGAFERLRIRKRKNLDVIDEPAHGLGVAALDFEVIRQARFDGSRAKIRSSRVDLDLRAVRRVLIDPGEHVELIVPA